MLGVGIGGLVGVDDARGAALTAGVAPISITNPDSVEGFETGTIDLAAGEVATWLGARSPDESDLARMYRVGLFWEAWLGEVRAAEDPSVVPGEIDSGRSKEHTSELQSLMRNSYAVFCLKKKNKSKH